MPFHEFNQVTGRLKQSANTQPLYPVSPRPLQSTEVDIMYDSVRTKPVKVQSPLRAGLSTLSPKLAELFRKYQADLEKPVYTLGGKKDRVLYAITIVGLTVGFTLNMYGLLNMKK
ncbi:uncharacterized protein LOC143217391 [Lasioglossum baleicum]|uniref:uncharacterized protein LOC143217391 n=1 Tax=Lasioglossum baleicum TaxID=434251 RepID=UPI003FCD2D12